QSLTLEKRAQGWWLTEPLESPVSRARNTELGELMTRSLTADSITYNADKAEEYGVSDALGTTVTMFAGDATEPKHTLVVGASLTVASTRAQRTYVRVAGEDTIHRVQADLASLRDTDVFAWRDKSVVQILDRDSVASFTVTLADETPATYTIEKMDQGWSVRAPEEAQSTQLEENAVRGVVSALTNLRAKGFVEDKNPSDLGLLDPPEAKIEVAAGGETITLFGSKREDTYYALRRDRPFLYELNQVDFERVFKPLLELRALTVLSLDESTLTGFTLAGEDRVQMRKTGQTWSMVAPQQVAEVPGQQLTSLLSLLTSVRAARHVTADLEASGTSAPKELVVLETTNGTHTIGLGAEVASEGADAGARYARIMDTEDVFVLSAYHIERLSPKATDLLPEPEDGSSVPE
ncbi:MAG: DUF4340 domain-containing protein, partial [Myxococcota bacterium]